MHTKTNIVAFKLNNVVLVCDAKMHIYIYVSILSQTFVFKRYFAFILKRILQSNAIFYI